MLVLYVLQGVGRGVWEASNKACFLAYFDYWLSCCITDESERHSHMERTLPCYE